MSRHTEPHPIVDVVPARLEWLEALSAGDHVFEERFGIPVEPGWIGFPEALPHTLAAARQEPDNAWGAHLLFDTTDGALVGFGGFKGAPTDGQVEIGYAVAPSRQGRGIAAAAVNAFVVRAATDGVVTVSAHTLATESPSTSVLRKTGFTRTAVITDPTHDEVWRWELTPTSTRPRPPIGPAAGPTRTHPTNHQRTTP